MASRSPRENLIPHSAPSGGPFKPFFGLSGLRLELRDLSPQQIEGCPFLKCLRKSLSTKGTASAVP
jgi:hypothetical protein